MYALHLTLEALPCFENWCNFHDQPVFMSPVQVKQLQLLRFLLFQVNAAAVIIYDDLVNPNANRIFGAVIDSSLIGLLAFSLFQ